MRLFRQRLIQAAAFQKRLYPWVAAGEVVKEFHRVLAAAAAEEGVAEVVAVFALQAAMFFEPLDAIGVEFFGPNVGIITG